MGTICKILILFMSIALVSPCHAEWMKTFGGSSRDEFQDLKPTSDGGYIIGGPSYSFGAGSDDIWLLKLNSDGDVQWQKTYGWGGGEGFTYNCIQQCADDSFIVFGTTTSTGAGSHDLWVLKLNTDGSVDWQKTYGGSGTEWSQRGIQTSDGGYIMTSETTSFGAGSGDIWVLKLNSDGTIAWQYTYGHSDRNEPTGILEAAEGGYVVMGDYGQWSYAWLLRLNGDGSIAWQKRYGSPDERGIEIRQSFDGGYIIAGENHIFDPSGDLWLLKLDMDGNITWQKAYQGSEHDWPWGAIDQTADGGYVLGGYTESFGAGSFDMLLLKIGTDGNILWQKTYGGSNKEQGQAVYQTLDGGFIYGGTTESFGAGNMDFSLLKLDSSGDIPGCDVIGNSNFTVINSTATVSNTNIVPQPTFVIAEDTSVVPQNTNVEPNVICYYGESLGLSYTPVTPCRIVDTRNASTGMIGASTERDFHVFGDSSTIGGQGGNSAGCSAPMGEPLAAHINMIAVNPTGKGNLQAFPVGAGIGAGLSVNYNAIDTNLANAGIVKTVIGSGPDLTVASNFSSAHTVIDVLGYYYENEGLYYTPVDPCRIADTRKMSAGIIDANTQNDFRVSGPVGDQGGDPAGCPSTLGASPEAAHLNMVAVNPTGKGNLQAFPSDAGPGAGLSVNYNTIDTNLANAGTVNTSPDISVASNFSSAHTVIDVLGYYSEEEDLLYTPVIPCRIVDTRKTSAGIIDANTQRDFRVFGPVSVQGGNSSGCSAPMGEPLAAHINMIAVNPTGKGNLQAFPVGAGIGAGLSVNYNAIDTNLANAGTVKTVTGSGPDITVASNFSSANTVIDVLGYYYPVP